MGWGVGVEGKGSATPRGRRPEGQRCVEGIIPVHIPGLKSEGGIFCCFSMIVTTTMRFKTCD